VKISPSVFGLALNSTLDKKEREFYVGRPSDPSVLAAGARIAGKKAFTQDRSKRKKSSHTTNSGKGVQLLPFLKSKRNSRLKEELHGWETKYTEAFNGVRR